MKLKIILIALGIFLPLGVFAQTDVVGNILSDTTWDQTGSPYVVNADIYIASTTTLTIDPGVVVKFSSNNFGIRVEGNLIAVGDSVNKIFFTSIKDDSVGGDTNGDGSSTVPSVGDWGGITVLPGANLDLKYTFFAYSGRQRPTINNTGGILKLEDSQIKQSLFAGVAQTEGLATISRTTFADQDVGISALGGNINISQSSFSNIKFNGVEVDQEQAELTIDGSVFSGSGEYAISSNNFFGGKSLTVTNCSFSGFTYPGLILSGQQLISSGNSTDGTTYKGWFRTGTVYENVTWEPHNDFVHIVDSLSVVPDTTITIESGAVLKFTKNAATTFDGNIVTNGIKGGEVYLTSIADDSVRGDTNNDGSVTTPETNRWHGIVFNQGSSGNITNTVIKHAVGVGNPISSSVLNTGGSIHITDSSISDTWVGYGQLSGTFDIDRTAINVYDTALNVRGGNGQIHNSDVSGASTAGIYSSSAEQIDATNNWWGDATGPFNADSNPNGQGVTVQGLVSFNPWLTEKPSQYKECCSSVAFIPGLQASRLYVQSGISEDRLWEPDTKNDVTDLFLYENGNPIRSDIYTRDVVNEVFGLGPLRNIYKSLIGFLNDMTTGTDKDINEWKALPYDWRKSQDNVVDIGSVVRDGEEFNLMNMVDEIIEMADRSQTGRVTIIGHSNGGLVGKLVISELERRGKASLVDKFIMVATPQLGTPQAIGVLLNGAEQALPFKWFPFIMDSEIARTLAFNMPSAYGLLPAQSYWSSDGNTVMDPVITFKPGGNFVPLNNAISKYGVSIDT